MRFLTLCTCVPLLATVNCGVTDPEDDPGAGFGEGKADSFTPPLVAELLLDHPGTSTVWFTDATDTAVDMVYAKFSLSGPATVSFETKHATDPHAATGDLDTVLYIYKPHGGYWGAHIAKDDDGGAATYSKLTTDLDAGSYRLLVRVRHGNGISITDLVTGCTGDGCKPQLDQTCADPHYGDGVCQTSLACQVPDIDCFVTFDDDAQAATWFSSAEQQIAAEQHRAPRAVVPQTDPRYVQARALADLGWTAFSTVRPVGELANKRPAVVVIEDPDVNAFVMPADPMGTHAAFSIQVQTGLLALNTTDDGRLGVMMHELQHAIGLHVIQDVSDRIRKFYVAPVGPELIGEHQADDPVVHAAWTAWRAEAKEAGPYRNPELGAFPIPGSDLSTVLEAAVHIGVQTNATGCTAARAAINQLRTQFGAGIAVLDNSLVVAPTFGSDTSAAFAELRDHCLASYHGGFIDVVAQLTGQTPAQVMAGFSAEDLAIVTGKQVIDGIAALTLDRRAKMLATEQSFTASTGRPWSALRFYSREESADDASILVLRGAQLEPTGLAHFLLSLLGSARTQCETLIASSSVPYGPRLDDDHHGSCFRAGHIEQRSAQSSQPMGRVAAPAAPPPALRRSWSLPPRLSDRVVY